MARYVEVFPPMVRGEINPYSLEEIAKRLLLLREALGNTQASMGRLAGVSGNAWGNYEKALRRIEVFHAIQLQIKTDATIEWIYCGVETRLTQELRAKLEIAREKQRQATAKAQKKKPNAR